MLKRAAWAVLLLGITGCELPFGLGSGAGLRGTYYLVSVGGRSLPVSISNETTILSGQISFSGDEYERVGWANHCSSLFNTCRSSNTYGSSGNFERSGNTVTLTSGYGYRDVLTIDGRELRGRIESREAVYVRR